MDDDEFFERRDSKDVHMNRSKEIVSVMNKISHSCCKKEVAENCAKLLDVFSMYPDIKDHLITHFGVTPILEMFEATQSCSRSVRQSNPLHSSVQYVSYPGLVVR